MSAENRSASEWVALLRAANRQDPGRTAGASVRTRGAPVRGPVTRAPQAANPLDRLFAELLSQPRDVRLMVVHELLRNPDNLGLRVLEELAVAPGDPSAEIRWTIAEGLRGVPDPKAVDILERIAKNDPDEPVRACAVGGMVQRARDAFAPGARPDRALPVPTVRTRSAVRTRDSSPLRTANPEARRILDALDRVRASESSAYVKQKIDLTLGELGD